MDSSASLHNTRCAAAQGYSGECLQENRLSLGVLVWRMLGKKRAGLKGLRPTRRPPRKAERDPLTEVHGYPLTEVRVALFARVSVSYSSE